MIYVVERGKFPAVIKISFTLKWELKQVRNTKLPRLYIFLFLVFSAVLTLLHFSTSQTGCIAANMSEINNKYAASSYNAVT